MVSGHAGSDTLWETWSPWTSIFPGRWAAYCWAEAQSAAAVPAFVLSAEVLGVRPTAPGFAEFEVSPQGGGLAWAEGVVPTPQGGIGVRWEKTADRYTLQVTVPKAGRGVLHLPPAGNYTIDKEPLGTDRLKRLPGGSVAIFVEEGTHFLVAEGLTSPEGKSLP